MSKKVTREDFGQVSRIREGIIKKGGVNPAPTTSRPNPPKGRATPQQIADLKKGSEKQPPKK